MVHPHPSMLYTRSKQASSGPQPHISSFSLGVLPPRAHVSHRAKVNRGTITLMFFLWSRPDAEKGQRRARKEQEQVAKTQQKVAAKAHKTQQMLVKQQQKAMQQQQKKASKRQAKAVHVAQKAAKRRHRAARKTANERKRRARLHSTVTAPPFAKSTGCFVCGTTFRRMFSRRRHHCRQCRKSCCLHCMSRTRRTVPVYGLDTPQKICVVCDTLVLNEDRPCEPVEAVAALAASRLTLQRPHSAPFPPTGVAVAMPLPRPNRSCSKSKSSALWTLPIRPLLKKKKKQSAEQVRNRTMDFNLQLDKQTMFSGRAIELQPQTSVLPMP